MPSSMAPHVQKQSTFLSRLPPEIRVMIHDFYTISYIQYSPHDAAIPLYKPGAVTFHHQPSDGTARRYLIEFDTQMPPLLQSCKQIAAELTPIAQKLLRLSLTNERTVPLVPASTDIAIRAAIFFPPHITASSITRLHLEYRIDNPDVYHAAPFRSPFDKSPEYSLDSGHQRALSGLKTLCVTVKCAAARACR
ncbi:hypothetical protein Micbo1qcDRAFT_219992 [Microdochium bolleyi]|uniref:Uncharacterized protein n=1 Tax=Microdochium bolleyi TaxID=196109 RepID=A0A136IMA8_9PEZI|nr:hypothetical protein Micbo1qcDRAFT_219992 [Microdochium bolleyi]